MSTSETQLTAAHDDPAPDLQVKMYFTVFIALSIFTAVSFFSNEAVRQKWISAHANLVIVLGVAVVKAFLVGLIFMHLKFDWPRVYFIIVPISILAFVMILAYTPDQITYWQPGQDHPEPPISATGTR